MTDHISVALTTILNPCTYCDAPAFNPCTDGRQELRYTHVERSR